MLDVALLGTGGMMPMPNRFLTALLCRLNGNMLLIDCGEGTQITMKLLGWGFKSVDIICFTHYHADHISGLPGLLLTIGNAGRTEPLHLVGPLGLAKIVQGLCLIAPDLPFGMTFTELDARVGTDRLAFGDFNLAAFPMAHGTPCLGYSLSVSRLPKFDLSRAEKLNIPKPLWGRLQRGEAVTHIGQAYTPKMVQGPPRKGIKLCYCTDSRPPKGLAAFIQGADLFVCEGIYGDNTELDKAKKHRHMIFAEAAQIAKNGGVAELWLTHFSPAMPAPHIFLQNAADIFPNTRVGFDRMHTTIFFEPEFDEAEPFA